VKINKISTYMMRNDTHFQFFTEFKGLVAKSGAGALGIEAEFSGWLPLYEREDAALKKIVKSALTAQIQEADKARDVIFTGMLEMNSAALKHFSADVRSAATRLKIVFDTYGNVAKLPLNDETSAIYNLLQELEGGYAADAAAVGIGSWVGELKARNNAFAALVTARFDETALRTDIVLKEARSAVDAGYFAMRERINAFVVINGGSAYETFIKTLNAIIDKYKARVGRKGGRHGLGQGDEAAGEDEAETGDGESGAAGEGE